MTAPVDGVVLVDKDADGTSHDMVQRGRRILGQKKIGHCGTLDPDATGLLVLTAGKATRLTRFLISAPKVYEGTIRFGVATDTYDAQGEVTSVAPIEDLTDDRVRDALPSYVGVQNQAPPPYRAKKVEGRKYYELARAGEAVPDTTKEVTVFDFEPLGGLADGVLPFRLACSSGTYVRSIAHDLGRDLGVGAHLASLRRTRVGPFDIADAARLADIEAAVSEAGTWGSWWVPFDDIPLPFGELAADAMQEKRILHGQTVLTRDLDAEEGDWVKILNRRRQLIAVGSVVERIGSKGVGIVRPKIVFN